MHRLLILGLGALLTASSARAQLAIPAFTAYSLPDPDGIRISERSGVARWTDPTQKLVWFGQFARTGAITARLVLDPPATGDARFRFTVAGQSREAVAASGTGTNLDFGEFQLDRPGYHALTLESLNPPDHPVGRPRSLGLGGPATTEAHFNLKERRNAASVHLAYPVAKGTNVAAFYSEVTAVEDPTTTFYMACGWHRGYFGMQVNSPTERRIIFSVWDSGGEAVDRAKVTDENRVKLVGKGDGVFSGDFGNEGTGGHSHLKYLWKTGETQRFLVTAQPTNGTFTVFAGYYFHPEKKAWMLISAWRAPKEGGWLRGLHGFSENFWGTSGHLVRKARYGNQWIRTPSGDWHELLTATFSHDPTGKSDRRDRTMGVENGQFFLRHGGFTEGYTRFGEPFHRPPTGRPPQDLMLPPMVP